VADEEIPTERKARLLTALARELREAMEAERGVTIRELEREVERLRAIRK
jgi:hypothetical protein